MFDHSSTTCPFGAALAGDALRWAHENNSERAQAGLARNRAELALARLCLCGMEEDGRHHITLVTTDLGQSDGAARDYRKIGLMLSRMPRLAEVLQTRGFAPLMTVKKLAAAVIAVEEDLCGELEPLVLQALTPGVDKLVMPSWRDLFPKVQAAIDTVQHAARPVDLAGAPIPEEVEETVRVRKAETIGGATVVAARLNPAHAEEAHRVLSTIAAVKECDNAQAFMHLVRGTAEVSVDLHLYRSVDGGGVWMPGVGVLSQVVAEEYLKMVTSVGTVCPSRSGGYAASGAQRDFVVGRDGVCMFPGCTRSAVGVDMDHVTNHAEGGPTCTDNIHGLCRRHHNEKTKGLWDVTRSLEGTEYWTSVGGSQVASEPKGPLRHPGVVAFGASVRKAGELRAEHNRKRDIARAEMRNAVVRARLVQPVVRMLRELRILSPEEDAESLIKTVTKEAAEAAEEAAIARAQERRARQKTKLWRYRAEAASDAPVVDPPAVSEMVPDPVLEIMQVYLSERDAVGALQAVGGLLARLDPGLAKPWERGESYSGPSPLAVAVERCRAMRFRGVAKRLKAQRKVRKKAKGKRRKEGGRPEVEGSPWSNAA